MNDALRLELSLNTTSGLTPFYPLLQRGFGVRTRLGCSVQTFLTEDLGIDADYIEHRIQTVFLDGHPVDDVKETTVTDGAVLALSAAMPGLVGATMRRSGVLAGFRDTITYRASDACASDAQGFVTIKLFNLLVRELGPGFLERAIWVEAPVLADLFAAHGDALERAGGHAEWEGEAARVTDLAGIVLRGGNERVRLTVHTADG